MSEQSKKQAPTKDTDDNARKGKKKNIKKKLLSILVVIIIVVAAISGYKLYEQNQYFSTENAKVTAKMYYVTPLLSGELMEWQASEGDVVEKNQRLGRMSALPYLSSPIKGTIVVNNGVEGQLVSPSTTLAIVADTDHQYIGVNVEETDIMNIEIGQKVDVKLDAYPNEVFNGVVADIDLTTQTYFSGAMSFSTSGTYTKITQLIPIKVIIENPDNRLLTFGMNASVKIHIADPVSDEEKQSALALNQTEEDTVRTYRTEAEAVDKMAIITMIAGKVNNIYHETGDMISKGDLLFSLEDENKVLSVKQAEASYHIAVAAYENSLKTSSSKSTVIPVENAYQTAKDNYDRIKALYDQGATSQSSLDAAKSQMSSAKAQLNAIYQSVDASLNAAKAQVDAAEATLEIAKKGLEYCKIEAPMSGMLVENNVAIGDMVSSQLVAMTLMDTHQIKVKAEVMESEIQQIALGDKTTVFLPALNRTFDGSVSFVSPISDAGTGLFTIEITVDNGDNLIKPGMTADVIMTLKTE